MHAFGSFILNGKMLTYLGFKFLVLLYWIFVSTVQINAVLLYSKILVVFN